MSKNDFDSKVINPDRGMQSRYNKMERTGGIYLEVNTNPDGWIFSDKMHKERYFVRVDSLAELSEKTDVELDVKYTPGKVEVKLPHPIQVEAVSVRGNNSVMASTFIKNPSKGLEALVAEGGQHITLEPVYKPNTRVHIYPKEHVFE